MQTDLHAWFIQCWSNTTGHIQAKLPCCPLIQTHTPHPNLPKLIICISYSWIGHMHQCSLFVKHQIWFSIQPQPDGALRFKVKLTCCLIHFLKHSHKVALFGFVSHLCRYFCMFIFVNLFKVWPINLILIFCKHCACQLNLSTKACDTSTAKESCLCTCCFDHSEQLVPNITLEIFSSLEQKIKKKCGLF